MYSYLIKGLSLPVFLLMLLSACGGGDEDNQISDTVGGYVSAPGGVIAHLSSDDSTFLAFMDNLVPKAYAVTSGLQSVINAQVELIRIDSNGTQVGAALSQGTTDGSGNYVMETGVHGIPPAGDLVIQVTGSTGVMMRAIYTEGGADVNPITDYIVDTVVNQAGASLDTLNILELAQIQFNTFLNSNIDFSSALTISDAKNLIAADAATNSEITNRVTNLVAARSVGLPIDVSQTSATSNITFSGCLGVPGGWSYSFDQMNMTVVGADTWLAANCTLGPVEMHVINITALAADADIQFNCAAYPVCDVNDFNKKLVGVDNDGRSFTSFYSYDGNSRTLTYIKHVPEQVFTEVITIN